MEEVMETRVQVDCYNQEIRIGNQVAFNMSGEIRTGIVEDIRPRKGWYHNLYPVMFHIRWDKSPSRFNPKNPVSKIKNGESILVLS